MPRNFKCSFCGHESQQAAGLMYVKNDGSILHFCSRRCRKSMLQFKRDPRVLKWTAYYGKKERGK